MPFGRRATFIFLLLIIFVGTGFAQRKVLSLNDVSSLLQAGVSSTRIVQLIEQNGVNFELDDQALRRLKQEGADGSVINVLQKASARYVQERQHQRVLVAAEAKRKQEQERQIVEEKKKIEETRRQQEEAHQRAEIERQQREKAEALEQQAREKKRRADEDAARRAEAEQLKLQEDARKRELELAKKQKAAELERAKLDPKTAVASLPACSVGLRHVFQYEDGGQFTRRIDRRDGGFCVIGRLYYDNNWTLVKQIGRDGEEITSSRPDYPLVGEKWLPFPLMVGKEWQVKYRARFGSSSGVGSFVNFFEIVGIEKINTRAGSFHSFKIRREQRQGGIKSGVTYYWYAPDVEYYVKHEVARQEGSDPNYWSNSVKSYELVSVFRPKK